MAVFNKLASQLTPDKLIELAVIPVIFVIQTLVSYLCSYLVGKAFGFKKRPRNFLIAMGVFGNSNSLPISLVISLSHTIQGLHWDKVPGDNDNEVAARGILYLLIFQQLGQLVRWTWGYNVLLAPKEEFQDEDEGTSEASRLENGQERYTDDPRETQPLLRGVTSEGGLEGPDLIDGNERSQTMQTTSTSSTLEDSGDSTPTNRRNRTSSVSTGTSTDSDQLRKKPVTNGTSPHYDDGTERGEHDIYQMGRLARIKTSFRKSYLSVTKSLSKTSDSVFASLPTPLQTLLSTTARIGKRFLLGVWAFMNPPLWAMLIAILVASIPSLQRTFFTPGTFVENSITSAIRQSGGVAVPLILVVLGANLARNTLPQSAIEESENQADPRFETKLVIASLLSRMLLPLVVMAPVLALMAKYVPVSILDDPIFVIVAFLLTGAPSALQLAQICQLNQVYMGVMSRLLVQSYVVWILPSTLVLVMLALETVEWAQQT